MKPIDINEWEAWLPSLAAFEFSDLSEAQQVEALRVFGDEATYQEYREAQQWGVKATQMPVPEPSGQVKSALDLAWAEEEAEDEPT
ncbi:MAG TPA: hypothetical protein DCR93_24360, partial [Cytophagales bacterium]|nr:hypothetical protein [Cytophagales bacterium]